MAFMALMAPCCLCGKAFTSNPSRVPSFNNQPICKSCITVVNQEREAHGLPLWPVHDDAYEPEEVA